MSLPTIVSVSNVSKRFVLHQDKSIKERIVNFGRSRANRDDFWALRDINLDIELGSTVGLVGHNGSGKSTLLKVIGGILQPTTGVVSRRGRMAALLELGAGFHPDLTGRENVYLNSAILGLTKKQTDKYFDAMVDFSGIEDFIDSQVKFYSSGMYVRLAFAVAVHVDPDLLLVDEVLAVGDEPFQQKCMDKIAEFQREGRTIVLVSHSSEQVGRLCDRVIVLNHGQLIQDGGAAEGIRVLRSGYEQDRLDEVQAKDQNEEPAAKIESISITSAERGPAGAIRSHSDLTLSFSYKLENSFPALVAGIAVETPTGQPTYGLNTRMLDLDIPSTRGQHTVDFVLRQQSLGAGQYVVRGSLEEKTGRSLDRLHPACTFAIEDPSVGSGLIAMNATANVAS